MENLDNKENNENLNIEQIEKPKKKKNITERYLIGLVRLKKKCGMSYGI